MEVVVLVGALQQASSATISARRPVQSTFELGRPCCRKPHSPLQAPAMASCRDDHGAALRRDSEQEESRRSSGAMQQVSSLSHHVFVPDLPSAIVKEIRKRIPLISFRDDEEDGESGAGEAAEVQSSHGAGVVAGAAAEQGAAAAALRPRCAWPRASLASAEEALSVAEGPRCAWPRGRGSPSLPYLAGRQAEDDSERASKSAMAAKCSWPRAAGRLQHSQEVNCSISSMSVDAQRHANNVNSKKATCDQAIGRSEDMINTSKDAPSMLDSSGKCVPNAKQGIEGPRCAWPRSRPHR